MLITRAQRQNVGLAQALEKLGAEVVSHPLIRIDWVEDMGRVNDCLERIEDFATVAFLSQNAAIHFAVALSAVERSQTMPPVGAIGPGTKSKLEKRGYTVQFLPEEANSESMANALIRKYQSSGFTKPILILRANRGSDVISRELNAVEIPFVELAIYRSVDVDETDPAVLQSLQAGEIDWLTVTSSAIATNAARLFGDVTGSTKIVSISPTTSQAARDAGLTVAAEATEYNMDGLIEAIIKQQHNL